MHVTAAPFPKGLALSAKIVNGESYPIKNPTLTFRCLVAEKGDGTDVRVTYTVKPGDWENYAGGIIPAGGQEELVVLIPWSLLLGQSATHYPWGIWQLYSKETPIALSGALFSVEGIGYDKAE
jgi:hypothetical protein